MDAGNPKQNQRLIGKNKTFSLEATSMSTGSVTCRINSPQACLQATNTTWHFRERQTIEQSYIFHNAYASQLLSTMFPQIGTLHSCGTHRKSRKGPSMSSASFLRISCEICCRHPDRHPTHQVERKQKPPPQHNQRISLHVHPPVVPIVSASVSRS
jgi:hypothetical protein